MEFIFLILYIAFLYRSYWDFFVSEMDILDNTFENLKSDIISKEKGQT